MIQRYKKRGCPHIFKALKRPRDHLYPIRANSDGPECDAELERDKDDGECLPKGLWLLRAVGLGLGLLELLGGLPELRFLLLILLLLSVLLLTFLLLLLLLGEPAFGVVR